MPRAHAILIASCEQIFIGINAIENHLIAMMKWAARARNVRMDGGKDPSLSSPLLLCHDFRRATHVNRANKQKSGTSNDTGHYDKWSVIAMMMRRMTATMASLTETTAAIIAQLGIREPLLIDQNDICPVNVK